MSRPTTLCILAVAMLPLRVTFAVAQGADSLDVVRRYGDILHALGEPDLRRVHDARTMYRVLWLRSFDQAIAVRIVRDGAHLSVITKRGPVWGHPEDTTTVRSDSTSLPQSAWDDLMMRTAMRDIWTTRATGHAGLDGAEWVLEAKEPGRYHVVDWWSPTEARGVEGSYRRLFLEILSLGAVCIKPDALY